MMKKFLSFLAFSFLLTTSISAQKMSDDQVVEYVKTATAAGKPQKQIMTELAAKGVTREQINEKLRAQGELQYDKVLEFLNQKGNRLPVDTINPNIMNGLMDLRFQVGALGGWDNLREAVLNGDLEGIKKESLVTFKDDNTGKIKPDARRNELRAEKFWHYD